MVTGTWGGLIYGCTYIIGDDCSTADAGCGLCPCLVDWQTQMERQELLLAEMLLCSILHVHSPQQWEKSTTKRHGKGIEGLPF